MKLSADEEALLAGEFGGARKRAMEQMIQVGRFSMPRILLRSPKSMNGRRKTPPRRSLQYRHYGGLRDWTAYRGIASIWQVSLVAWRSVGG